MPDLATTTDVNVGGGVIDLRNNDHLVIYRGGTQLYHISIADLLTALTAKLFTYTNVNSGYWQGTVASPYPDADLDPTTVAGMPAGSPYKVNVSGVKTLVFR